MKANILADAAGLAGGIGLFGLLFLAACAVVWLVFPFLVLGRLRRAEEMARRQIEFLECINKNIIIQINKD